MIETEIYEKAKQIAPRYGIELREIADVHFTREIPLSPPCEGTVGFSGEARLYFPIDHRDPATFEDRLRDLSLKEHLGCHFTVSRLVYLEETVEEVERLLRDRRFTKTNLFGPCLTPRNETYSLILAGVGTFTDY